MAHVTRLALVIGNSNYDLPELQLRNPVFDAQLISNVLQLRGFEVSRLADATLDQMIDAVKTLSAKCRSHMPAFVFIYFSGHACEQHGVCYLWPKELPSTAATTLPRYALPLSEVLNEVAFEDCTRVIALDCCRTREGSWNADERSRFEEIVELAKHRKTTIQGNTLISYSTSAGESAYDGKGNNSLYCASLSSQILNHRISVEDVFKQVGVEVVRSSSQGQRPWFYSSLSGAISFSDLPEIELSNVVETAVQSGNRGMLRDPHSSRVIVFGERQSIYYLETAGLVGERNFDNPVKLMTSTRSNLAHLDDRGQFWLEQMRGCAGYSFTLHDTLALAVAPSGVAAIFCSNGSLQFADLSSKKIFSIPTPAVSWYGALFFDDDKALALGSAGESRLLTLKAGELTCQAIGLDITNNLYAATWTNDNTVFICGSGGFLAAYDLDQCKFLWQQSELGRTPRTASIRTQCLSTIVSDPDVIKDFLFSPELLSEDVRKFLKSALSSNNLLYVTHMPSTPILIAGSEEGLLYVVDARDGRLVQTIDTAAGKGTNLNGLCYSSPDEFAVFSASGSVSFYSLVPSKYDAALSYLDQ